MAMVKDQDQHESKFENARSDVSFVKVIRMLQAAAYNKEKSSSTTVNLLEFGVSILNVSKIKSAVS